MFYYRVKEDYDQSPRFYERPNHKLKQNSILVKGELYTPCERSKIMNSDYMFEEVNISKKRIYWFFGCRFADE